MGIAGACPYFKFEKGKIAFCEYADLHPPDKKSRQEILYGYCGHPENFRRCLFYIAMENYYERKYLK